MDLIRTLEQEEIKRLKKEVPDFSPGDTVVVNVTWSKARESACRPSKAW